MQLFEPGPNKKQRRTDFPGDDSNSRMGENSPFMPQEQAVSRVVLAFISLPCCWLFYGVERLAGYLPESQGANNVPLAQVGWKTRPKRC